MSKSPRELQELITAVDAAGHGVHVNVDSASSWDSSKRLGHRRRSTYNNGRAVVEASTEASFEFSAAVVSYSSASPASMVFSDGQLRAHQFPAVRSSAASRGSRSQATSPLQLQQSSSVRSRYNNSTNKQRAGVTGSKKRVSFATDGADRAAAAATGKAGGGLGKKSGGLLGCMGSACRTSSRNEAVEPVARNNNNLKVVAF